MKIWLAIMIFLLCVGTTLVSKAQNTFSKAYDVNDGGEIGAAISILNDGYLLFGTGSISSINLTYILKVVKIDTLGNLLWIKQYGSDSISYSVNYAGGGLTSDQNGNYYTSGVFVNPLGEADLLVTKIDDGGDTIWTRVFGGPEQEVAYAIYYDSTQQYLYVTGGSLSFGPGLTNVAVWVLDTSGNTINTWFYGGGDYDYGRSIVKIGDTLYISGYTSSYGKETEPFLMKLDTAGNVADLRFYGTDGRDTYAGLNTNATNDRLVIWGRLDTLQNAVFISQLDLAGETVWRKILNWNSYIYQVRFLEDNSLIAVGENYNGRINGCVAKLDSLGDMLWYRRYYFNDPDVSGYFASCTFYDFKTNEQADDILCFGNTLRDPALGDSTGQDFWLVKLDSMGCLIPGCDTITEVGIQHIETIGTQVTVYPNPANGKATVLLNHGKPNSEVVFTLHSISGQLETTEKHLLNPYGFGEWQVDLTGREPGIYIYHILQDGKTLNGKLIIE